MPTHSTETFFRTLTVNQFVVQPLAIPLATIVGDELLDGLSIMAFAERIKRFRHSSLIERTTNRSAFALGTDAVSERRAGPRRHPRGSCTQRPTPHLGSRRSSNASA
jgi:hypothetical protein